MTATAPGPLPPDGGGAAANRSAAKADTGRLPRWPARVIGVSTVMAWVALACVVAAVVLFVVPVTVRVHSDTRNREITAQQCGAPVAFLVDARTDSPVASLDRQELAAFNRRPCSAAVADRAVPGGALLLAAFVVGITAFGLAWIGHRADQRTHLQAEFSA